jgi:hypothetical protein
MIKYFRKIRQNLLSEGKTGKYLKYAIGEIVLVVIGILIALQINNWNQSKAKGVKEIEILKAFQNQFENDVIEIDSSLAFYKGAKNSIGIILNHLENDLSYNDSLKLHFFATTKYWMTSDLDNHVFETLKSIGVDLISNQDIRNRIIKIYEDHDEWIEESESVYLNVLYSASENIFNTRFKDFWNGDYKDKTVTGEMVPLDFENLKSDQEYLYFLRTQKHRIGWLLENPMESTKIEVLKLLKDLTREIERLENK